MRIDQPPAYQNFLIVPVALRHVPAITMQPIISVENLSKTYASGYEALKTSIWRSGRERSSPCSARTAPARRR